ncbi:ZP domain-containing protein [Meloidogyne graminicola]|uniref:ZP domain-containing protein n=1 Tax=Meloidogyne graminicola TaxID=189291 RepID=A0A8S9ZZA2_9BILA|nr:ZP domain-containing protein [Meloidogyne graminicola]
MYYYYYKLLLLITTFFIFINSEFSENNLLADNELFNDPIVECEETMISLTFRTKKPFNGRIYVQGMADDERCSKNFASNADQSKFSMMIQNGDCTMQRQRVTGPLEGMMLSLTIVVSFHGTFVTRSDRAFHCMCFFRNIKHLTNILDMNMVGTTELMDTIKTPTCHYSIHSQSPDGPAFQLGKVGDKVFHVWECDDSDYGFLVHSCAVDDGKGLKFDLLDVDGCAIDPIIQPDVEYTPEKNRAFVETFGYKFSDTTVLNYQCSVELCKKAIDECHGLTPPICGRQKRGIFEEKYERRMDLITSLKILDAVYESNEQFGNEKALEKGEMVAELTEINPTRENAYNCVRSMAVAFVISVMSAILLIIIAIIVLFILKRDEKEEE